MNYIMNPKFISKVLKSYFFDINRLWELDQQPLRKFQEKKIIEMINYAYHKVTLYHKKYHKLKIKPTDIKNIEDFQKIPFIKKDDFRGNIKKDVIPRGMDKKVYKTSTSGTTGRPATVYISMLDAVQGVFGYLRILREHGINWRKDNIAFLLDLRSNSAERTYFSDGIITKFKPFLSFDNIRIYDIFSDPKKLIKELDDFQPICIGGYVGILGHLAILKEKGLGKNICPKIVGSTGTPLDKYLRKFIEEAFNTKMFDTYGATETGPIAFECRKKKMHVCSDLVYTEFLKKDKLITTEEPSSLIITKMYGEGTPIIRYIGIDDILIPSIEVCDCGLGGNLIKKIYGRKTLSLIFPNKKVMLPSAHNEIFSRVLYEYRTRMIKKRQIIQHKLNELEIKLVLDQQLKEKVDPKDIFSMIKYGFIEKIGSDIDVNIKIKEVKDIDQDLLVVSNIDINKFDNLTYI